MYDYLSSLGYVDKTADVGNILIIRFYINGTMASSWLRSLHLPSYNRCLRERNLYLTHPATHT